MVNPGWPAYYSGVPRPTTYAPTHERQPQMTPQPKVRLVSGIEEARAAQIEYDGSLYVFVDMTNGKVYIKYLGVNGLPCFDVYAYQEPLPEVPVPSANLTPDDIQKYIDASTSELKTKISQLESKLEEILS